MITTYTLNTNPPKVFQTYQGALDEAQELFATKGVIVSITEDIYEEVEEKMDERLAGIGNKPSDNADPSGVLPEALTTRRFEVTLDPNIDITISSRIIVNWLDMIATGQLDKLIDGMRFIIQHERAHAAARSAVRAGRSPSEATNRFKNALAIFMGAVNPSGIAHAIVDAYNEMRDEPGFTGTAQVCKDPAIRLMVYQLAFLCGIDDKLMVKEFMECKERVGDKT